jgi:hypothetical protein
MYVVHVSVKIAYVYTKVRPQFGKDVKPCLVDEPADVSFFFIGTVVDADVELRPDL